MKEEPFRRCRQTQCPMLRICPGQTKWASRCRWNLLRPNPRQEIRRLIQLPPQGRSLPHAVRSKIDRCGNLRVRHAERIRNGITDKLEGESPRTEGVWGESEVVARGRTGNGCRTNQGHSTQLKILGCIEIRNRLVEEDRGFDDLSKRRVFELKPGLRANVTQTIAPKLGDFSNRERAPQTRTPSIKPSKVRPQYPLPTRIKSEFPSTPIESKVVDCPLE